MKRVWIAFLVAGCVGLFGLVTARDAAAQCADSANEDGGPDCSVSGGPILVLNGRVLGEPSTTLETHWERFTPPGLGPLLAVGSFGVESSMTLRHRCSGAIVSRVYASEEIESRKPKLRRISI